MAESVFVSFERIVRMAKERGAELIVISGDVFDEVNETAGTRYRFSEMLRESGIPCVISLGNHDYKRSWETSIPYPDNVHVFGPEAESKVFDTKGGKVEVVGRSFSTRHTSMNLAASLKGDPDLFTIACIHCSVDDAKGSDYAPCRLSDLSNRYVDYWALGHIHKRAVLGTSPYVVYPGNIQGRDPNENGEKGAYLVTVTDGRVSELEFVSTQSIIWKDVSVDITGKDINGMMSEISKHTEKDSIIRLHLTGRGELDRALRLGADEMIKNIQDRTGSLISADIRTHPAMDTGSFAPDSLPAKIDGSAKDMAVMDRAAIIDSICSTKCSDRIKALLEGMSDEDISKIVEDARMYVLEKLTEGSS